MKTAGLIGGIAWPSTLAYYRLINQQVQQALGGKHSARCVVVSMDFAELYDCMVAGRPDVAAARMADAARQLKAAGADLVAILANTGHFAAEEVREASGLPLVHIAEATAVAMKESNPAVKRLALLGTSYALAAPFFSEVFERQFGFELVLPNAQERADLDAVIFEDLAGGEPGAQCMAQLHALCVSLRARGAEAAVLGCTELSLVHAPLQAAMGSEFTLFDSTALHAQAIVRQMLEPPICQPPATEAARAAD